MADTITISTVSVCAGGEHVTVTGTLNGQQTTFKTTIQELGNILSNMEKKERSIARCYFRLLEENAVTLAQKKTALEGWSCKI